MTNQFLFTNPSSSNTKVRNKPERKKSKGNRSLWNVSEYAVVVLYFSNNSNMQYSQTDDKTCEIARREGETEIRMTCKNSLKMDSIKALSLVFKVGFEAL